MSNVSLSNGTAAAQYQGLLERLLFSAVTTAPCCVFLFINSTMLFTLKSRAVFRESSRYVLLYNLLVADTMQMSLSQIMYILAVCRTRLTYPVCGLLVMLAKLTNDVSPLTLVVMSLERYVAVCRPLRHAAIATVTNTGLAIALVWAVSSLNVLIRVLLLLDFPFEDMDTLQMKDFCSDLAMFLGPMSDNYDRAYTCFVFVSATAVIVSTYVGVMLAAGSASTDRASAQRARHTLLLHLVQLGLSLSSAIYNPVLLAFSRVVRRLVFVRLQNVLYVCVSIFPRCLSSLIYGVRDGTIRPALMYHLCCRLKVSSFTEGLTRGR